MKKKLIKNKNSRWDSLALRKKRKVVIIQFTILTHKMT
jgi:hypothetical protein